VPDVAWTALRQRALAFGLGVVLTVGGLWGAAAVLILGASAAQLPDSRATDFGDPCCPAPDTWVDVAEWSGLALVLAVLDAVLMVLGGALLFFAVRGRRPRPRVARVPLVVAPAGAALILLGLLADAMM
jgi:hypothetical protein